MNHGSDFPKVLITGHTRGIGRAIYERLKLNRYDCVGMSKSTGDDIIYKEDVIVEMINDFDHVVLNAYAGDSQLKMLKKIIQKYKDTPKRIAVITSTSGTPEGEDDDEAGGADYKEYKQKKKELIAYIGQAQQSLIDKPLNIFDVCPDTVYTDMTKGLWEQYPKLNPDHVARCVMLCLETKDYNINKIVIQKNAD